MYEDAAFTLDTASFSKGDHARHQSWWDSTPAGKTAVKQNLAGNCGPVSGVSGVSPLTRPIGGAASIVLFTLFPQV